MAELLPNWIQGQCYTAQVDRLLIKGLVCGDGVADVMNGSLAVTTGASGLNLSVAQGGFFVAGDDDDRGVYHGYNDAAVTLTAAAADPTNPRIDQVIARVYDSTYGEAADEWVLEMLAGTATAGATLTNLNGATALPDNSIRLAYILVPATFVGPFVNATHIKDARTEFVSCGAPSMPYVRLEAAATTSVPNNSNTKINLATTVHNDDEFFSVTSSVVTILKAGVYDVVAQFGFDYVSATTMNYAFMEIDTVAGGGGALAYHEGYAGGMDIGNVNGTMSVLGQTLAAGTTVQLNQFQTQLSGTDATNTDTGNSLTIRKVG